MHNLTTSYFERKATKFVGNKTAIYRRNRSSVCLLFVKLALVCVFSSLGPGHTELESGDSNSNDDRFHSNPHEFSHQTS